MSFSCQSPAASGQPRGHRRANGFSLVAALFLIVVVAALGAFAVRIGGGEQQTVNLQLLSARALAAANSGIEFGAYRALVDGSCVAATLNLTEAAANGFTVNVTCSSTLHTEGSVTPNNVSVFRIDATAFAGVYGMPDYVSRHVYATFTNVP
jgi:MSHA biogenesis protein MshP